MSASINLSWRAESCIITGILQVLWALTASQGVSSHAEAVSEQQNALS